MSGVENRVGHFRLSRAVFILKQGLGTKFGLTAIVLLVLFQFGHEAHLSGSINVEHQGCAIMASRNNGAG